VITAGYVYELILERATPDVTKNVPNHSDESTSELRHMPQLDALRVFAVVGVLIQHYWGPLPFILEKLNLGFLGVRLFFVLSGFLITSILLGCRDVADKTGYNRGFYARQFYIRRLLRIFPIYYLVVAAALIVNLQPAREIAVWLISYTSNIYVAIHEHWIEQLGHFWTLAVEEQFYFAWPWFVLFVPRRMLPWMTIVIILLGPLYRFYAASNGPDAFTARVDTIGTFTLACFDTLGTGSLLAIMYHSDHPREKIHRYLSRLVLPVGIIATLFLYGLLYYGFNWKVHLIFADLSVAMIFCWLVSAASLGFKGVLGAVLEWQPLVYTGKMTYGIYVYHNFIPLLFAVTFKRLGLEYSMNGPFNFALASLTTWMVAALSWHLVEQPINGVKRYFKYHRDDLAHYAKMGENDQQCGHNRCAPDP